MISSFKCLLISISCCIFVSCSLDVKKAVAPTNPPKVSKNLFSVKQIEGQYKTSSTPVMFLWPTDKWSEAKQAYVPLSFSEQAQSRKEIVRLSEDKAKFEGNYKKQEPLIIKKYDQKREKLIGLYKLNLCYTLCDPFDFTCEPDNPDNFPQNTWKIPENPEEELAITYCQNTQKQIEGLDSKQTEELQAALLPATQASFDLLAAVGDRNFFNELSTFEINYAGVESCFVKNESPCLKLKNNQKGTLVTLLFKAVSGEDLYFSNDESGSEKISYKIENVELDKENGYLTFTMPAVDFSTVEKKIYGELSFDLELTPKTGQMTVNGDVKLMSFDTNEERVGRFNSTGNLIPLQK